MVTMMTATFDGTVLRLDEPLELAPNTRVRLTIEPDHEPVPAKCSFLQTASALQIQGPPDWSENLEEYLHGEKKTRL
jgi:hypothetical protein